jgi:membrane protease subunit HflK
MPWNPGGPETPNSGSGNNPGGPKPGPWGVPPPKDDRGNEPQRDRGPNGPWGDGNGRRPNNGGPFDIDALIARLQAALRGILPPGLGGGFGGGGGGGGGFSGAIGGRSLALLLLLVVGAWLASGFYRVQPDEQGVVLRFGAYRATTFPGLNYHLPWPVEQVLRPAVTRIERVEVGYRTMAEPSARAVRGRDATLRDVPEESLMLTGDENIIDIDFAVFWRVSDAGAFLFNTRHPESTVKSAAESVMREVIGRTPIQPALTGARGEIETAVLKGVQAILDDYKSGVEITQVQMQKVDPPAAVIDSFRDLQRASTDADRMRNEAQAYHNDIVPRARGDAARLVAEADAARQVSTAESTGQAQRFLSVLKAYQAAKDVTMQRLYIETMQNILSHTQATIVDNRLQGVVPFLSLSGSDRANPLAQPAPKAGAAK